MPSLYAEKRSLATIPVVIGYVATTALTVSTGVAPSYSCMNFDNFSSVAVAAVYWQAWSFPMYGYVDSNIT